MSTGFFGGDTRTATRFAPCISSVSRSNFAEDLFLRVVTYRTSFSSFEFQYKNKMDIIKYQNNEWAISTSAAETETFRLDYIDLTDSYYDDSNNIYNLIAALPLNTEFNGYVDFIDSDGETYYGLTDNVSVNLESGKQYDFVFDLYSMTLVAESKNKSVMKSNYRTLQKRLFESNNSKKSFYAIEFLN